MADSVSKKLFTTLGKGLWKDSLHSLQPDGTWRDAWSVVVESDEEGNYGVSNEPSNELLTALPGNVRGLLYVEERDQWVVFIKGANQEIGIIDEKEKCYRTVVSDTELADIGICDTEWIDVTAKVVYPCNHLHIYWSANDEYRKLNLDDPCCKFEETRLFKCSGVGAIKKKAHEKGGGIPNGKYGFAVKLRDKDGNDTNWYPISDFTSVASGDYKPGERSDYAINISLEGLHKDYSLVDLAVVAIVDNLVTVEHFDTISYGVGGTNYLYRGKTGREVPLTIQDILTRNPRYYYGKNLIQYDGRLLLYNVRPENNLDYQRQANEIQVKYTNNVVPTRYAHLFNGLRPNENYWIAIRWNFCDGTHSTDFLIPGREAGSSDMDMVDSCRPNCPLPAWRVQDTSVRTETFFGEADLVGTNNNNQDELEYTDPVSDEEDILFEDETTAVTYDPSEIPDPNKLLEELDFTINDTEALFDCICPKVMALWEEVKDCDDCISPSTMTRASLIQLVCMCEDRETSGQSKGPRTSGRPIVGRQADTRDDGGDTGDSGAFSFSTSDSGSSSSGSSSSSSSGSCTGGGCGGSGSTNGCDGSDYSSDYSGVCVTGNCSGCEKAKEEAEQAWVAVGGGKTPARALDYAINKVHAYFDELAVVVESQSTRPGSKKYLNTGLPCSVNGRKKCNGPSCVECVNGTWKYINNADMQSQRAAIGRQVKGADSIEPRGSTTGFSFEYIYDSDGCTIIGVKPKKYSEGLFGYWETRETYPMTENCDCEKIYGDKAGKNVMLHRVPSVTKEPHFVSFSGGVPNQFDQGNEEDKNSFTFFIGLKLENITPPKNLPKPLNESNPFTITYVERTEANKTVLGSGIGISCFKGEIQGETFAFPKHGVNSFERFDRSIEPQGSSSFRGGTAFTDAAPYVIHSPDFHLRRPPLDATDCLIELEYNGKGFRHGLYAEGEEAQDPRLPRENQKGTRQSLNLNHYSLPIGSVNGPVVECVKSMTYAPADSVVSKSDEFSYSLCNLWRESSVYMELERSSIYPLKEEGATTGNYGGLDGNGDNASDRSFTGDTLNHEMPIHDVRALYMTFTRYNPYQYGSPIGQAYIPIGLEGDANALSSGTLEGVVGDSFVNTMSVKRTSYVSDKTPRKLSKIDDTLGIVGDGTGFWNMLIGGLMKAIGKAISIKKGGYIPETGDPSEYINMFGGMRDNGTTIGVAGHPGETTNGNVPPRRGNVNASNTSDHNDGDNYFPQLLKSNVFSWYNSDANHKFRQVGSVDNGEVYYKELRTLKLDSSMPFKWDWKKAFLNRFYTDWDGNAKWKGIVAALILFLFTYGIGLWIIVSGFTAVVQGISAMGGGTYGLRTIGGAISAVFGIALIVIGVYWMYKWSATDADNKVVEDMVGLKNLRPDVKNVDGSYSLKDGRVKQLEDNYWRYDNTHSWVNRFEVGYGMSDPYNTCYCPEKRSNKIPYSNKQILDSQIDSWSNFRANNTVDIPTTHGNISKMFQIGNGLYVHTTDMIISLQAGSRELQINNDNLLLGTGDLFNRPLPIYGGVVEGYGGLKDPNAAIISNWGYIFPDRESRKLYTFNGSGLPSPISDDGVKGFLQENGTFKLLEQFPKFKMVDLKTSRGIGFSLGIDHEHNRLLLTKIDYVADEGVRLSDDCLSFVDKDGNAIVLGDSKYFCNKSFTLSYNLSRSMWSSFHYYLPHLYAWNRFNMFSFNNEGIWTHNIKGDFQRFYDKSYPFHIEVIANDRELLSSFKHVSTDVDLEVYRWDEYDYIRNPRVFFDELIAYNSHQSTGVMPLVNKDTLSLLEGSREDFTKVLLEYKLRRWNYADLIDKLVGKDGHIFGNTCSIGPSELNRSAHSDYRVNNDLFDNFLSTRYTFFNKDNNLKIFLKNVRTEVDVEEV